MLALGVITASVLFVLSGSFTSQTQTRVFFRFTKDTYSPQRCEPGLYIKYNTLAASVD